MYREVSAGGTCRHTDIGARSVAAHGTPAYAAQCMTIQRLLKTLQAHASLLTPDLLLRTVIDAHMARIDDHLA
jgi:hypothetical protein